MIAERYMVHAKKVDSDEVFTGFFIYFPEDNISQMITKSQYGGLQCLDVDPDSVEPVGVAAEEMNYCPNCDKKLVTTEFYCFWCGQRII